MCRKALALGGQEDSSTEMGSRYGCAGSRVDTDDLECDTPSFTVPADDSGSRRTAQVLLPVLDNATSLDTPGRGVKAGFCDDGATVEYFHRPIDVGHCDGVGCDILGDSDGAVLYRGAVSLQRLPYHLSS